VEPSSFEFTKPTEPDRLGDGDAFTKLSPLRMYVCQDSLFEGAKQAERLGDFLRTELGCILD
jgi:hypothetical protein